MSSDPIRRLAVSVILQAVMDARTNADARAWLLDPYGGMTWLDALDIAMPANYAEWVSDGCPHAVVSRGRYARKQRIKQEDTRGENELFIEPSSRDFAPAYSGLQDPRDSEAAIYQT